MAIENRLIGARKKRRRPARPGLEIVRSWPVYRGPLWLGDILILDAPITAEPMTFDAITPSGELFGPFASRLDAAMAIGARAGGVQ